MSLSYAVVVFDEADEVVAVIENATAPEYNRSSNAADQVQFEVPREHVRFLSQVEPPATGFDPQNKIQELKIGRRFEVIRGEVSSTPEILEVSGFISERGFDGEVFKVSGFTEESVLERFLTPSTFGYVLSSENETLADLVNEFTSSYSVERMKKGWSDFIQEEDNIVYTESGSDLDRILIDDVDVPFNGSKSGSFTARFELDNELLERIRWVSDYDEEQGLTTKISYWVNDNDTFVPYNPSNYSTPVAGALTDITGLVVNQSGKYVDVHFELETTQDEVSPAVYAVEVVKRKPIQLGGGPLQVDVPAGAAGVATPGIEANNKSFLQVLIDVAASVGWEFKVERGTLIVREEFGTDRTNDYVLVQS